MKITQHKLVGATYVPSPNFTDTVIVPRFIVMHYTGSLRASSSISWLADSRSKVSAHLVIDREGSVTQMVDFNKKAWHAGPSSSQGYSGLNNHSIGIELLNIGILTVRNDDVIDGYGRITGLDKRDLQKVQGEYWLPYSEKQLDELHGVVEALVSTYPSIFDCVGHEEIDTRKKKRDPGPLFPMPRYDSLVSQRGGDFRVHKTISKLNVRISPSSSSRLAGPPISKDTEVTEVNREGKWIFANVDGFNIGYVHSDYLRRIR